MVCRNVAVAVTFVAICASLASAAIIQVGPTRTYKGPSQAGVNASAGR